MLRRKTTYDPMSSVALLHGRRVLLRPLTLHDFDEWREVRRRCHDWLTKWEPRRIPRSVAGWRGVALNVLAPTESAADRKWAAHVQHGSGHDALGRSTLCFERMKSAERRGRSLSSVAGPGAKVVPAAREGRSDLAEGGARWTATRRGVAAAQ